MTFLRVYNILLCSIALWGLTAIALTTEYNYLIIGICYVFILTSFFSQRFHNRIAPVHWNILTLIATAGAGITAIRGDLLDATVYFFMFLQVAKLFNNRTASDTLWVYAISFFQIVGAAVLTSSLVFGGIFVTYVMLMTGSFILFTIRRQSELTDKTALGLRSRFGEVLRTNLKMAPHASAEAVGHTRIVPRTFMASTAIITLFIVGITLIFFAAIPRLHSQKLFEAVAKKPDPNNLSAFDEAVEFGNFEKIQLDPSVAMYVRPDSTEQRPDHVRMRGVSLDEFDGRRWRRSTSPQQFRDQTVVFDAMSRRQYAAQSFTVIQPPHITNYLFANTLPESLKLDFSDGHIYYDRNANSAWLPQVYSKEIQYKTQSRVETTDNRSDPAREPTWVDDYREFVSDPKKLDEETKKVEVAPVEDDKVSKPGLMATFTLNALQNLLPSKAYQLQKYNIIAYYKNKLLTVPPSLNTPRMKGLATELTAEKNTPFEKAVAVEQYLRTRFSYTLEPKAQGNYIEDFLFNTKQGHCEYFATSMVMLLRLAGIPSRIVNGFYCVEWNDIGEGHFTVRQRDAHSWVEAYFERYGWMTFDPTPAVGVGRPWEQNAFMMHMNRLIDGLKVQWYRYIIDYSFSDQQGIVRGMLKARNQFAGLLQNLRQTRADLGIKTDAALGGITFVVIIGLIGLVVLLAKFISMVRRRLKPLERKRTTPVIRYYQEILHLLQKRGHRRKPAETPREFAAHLSTDEQLALFAPITEMYYENRFSGTEPTEEQLERVRQFVRELKQPKIKAAA